MPLPPFRGSAVHATLMLVVTTFFWGMSFPLMKTWLNAAKANGCPGGDVLAGLTLIGLRAVLGLLLFAVIAPRLFRSPSRRELGIGLLIGCTNCLGCTLQVWGLALTTPALSVFFTSVGSAWVPLLAFVCFRITVARLTLLGLLLGIGGAAVLGIQSATDWTFGRGEWLTLLSSVVFGVVILLVDRLGRKVAPGHLTVGFMAGGGLPALFLAGGWAAGESGGAAWLTWLATMLGDPWLLTCLGLLTVFPTVLALHWMSTYQPRVPASRAALLYLLEPVFGAALSVLAGHDKPTLRLLLGGGLILGGNLLVELPALLRDWRMGAWTEKEPSPQR